MRKTMIVCSLLLCPAFVPVLPAFAQQVVKEYTHVTGLGVINNSNDTVIVIRRFMCDSTVTYLTVDPESLSTSILSSGAMIFSDIPWQTIYARFAATPYIKALKLALATDDSLQNAGIRRFPPSQQGINLTIDRAPPANRLTAAFLPVSSKNRVCRKTGSNCSCCYRAMAEFTQTGLQLAERSCRLQPVFHYLDQPFI